MENVEEWIEINGRGDGSGYGRGDGSGYGYSDGRGRDNGSCDRYGRGSGNGCGSGYGSGSGYGHSDGRSSGDGSGYGRGIGEYNKKTIYLIDGIPTVLTHIRENFATGYILNDNFTLTPCVIAKGNGYFAHGKTFHEAREALRDKIFENMDVEDTISEFVKTFEKEQRYSGTMFFEWHHHLTGSCLTGRESFVKNHGIDLSNKYTVKEFIAICENDYGGDIVKRLKEFYD